MEASCFSFGPFVLIPQRQLLLREGTPVRIGTRALEPKSMIEETKRLIEAPWSKKVKDGLGSRPASLEKLYEMKPETPVAA